MNIHTSKTLTVTAYTDADLRDATEPLEVRVREVRIRDIDLYLATRADDANRIATVTGLDEATIDRLTHAAVAAIIEADEEINAPLANARQARLDAAQTGQLATMRKVMPEVFAKVEAQIEAQLRATMGSSPSSPSAAAPQAGAGSAPSTTP